MEIISDNWISQLEMEDPTMISSMDFLDVPFDFHEFQSNPNSPMCEFNFSTSPIEIEEGETSQKPINTNTWNFSNTKHTTPISSTPCILSFDNSNSPPTTSKQDFYSIDSLLTPMNSSVFIQHMNHESVSRGTKRVSTETRSPLHAHEHVMAERERRAKLNERFIALSAVLPGLKKTDKASVLKDSVKYIKDLEERVKIFEEQMTNKSVESTVFVKKTQLFNEDDGTFEDKFEQTFPNIEAKVSDKDVLIRIHCEKRKGRVSEIVREIEKLHLTIVNSSVLPFGNSTIDVTIIAQIEAEYCFSTKELVRCLHMKFR